MTAAPVEHKMGLTGSPTAQLLLEGARVPVNRRIGAEGDGLKFALDALNSGLADRRLRGRPRPGRARRGGRLRHAAHPVRPPDHRIQGLEFLLADMAAGVESARATYLDAARRRDRGLPFRRQASIAKLVATDMAMRVTMDAVQVLGGAGDTATSLSSATCAKPRSADLRGHQPDTAHGHRREFRK